MSGLAAAIFLIWNYFPACDMLACASVLLYLLGMLASYTASTLYHSCPENSPWRLKLRKLDHAAIYWHIAGSYSPITLIALRDSGFWGWGIFIVIWLCALLGTVLTYAELKDRKNHFETVCYVVMGLLIVVAFKYLMAAVPMDIVWWIVAEGVFYITGAIFYSVYRIKYMHFVFHMFVLCGSISHFMAVWGMLEYFLEIS